ncbi:hypothetical protein D7Y13_01980 [Corallococcus praedator]|uniref:Uncharacterized protein n=1 Tax=Corallococcus praedator TaxID=2316724 RepID=A0ABX9QRA7_9BACT|nr:MULTISPECIES: hypothetical protein [Corallococcus]RKH34866.1 hypothetical protein D7X75_06645 [Corallococcus sp. CA031C]RKI16731.1 hypothetical protein D7Y13_01980 [Corallococcus praedator]
MVSLLVPLYWLAFLTFASPPTLADFFQKPDRVEVYRARMDPTPDTPPKEDTRPRVGMAVFTVKGQDLTPEERKELAATWTSPENTPKKGRMMCPFNPDMALRFWRGDTWVDVVVCFGCGEQLFYDAKKQSLAAGRLTDFTLLHRIADKNKFPRKKDDW